MKKLLLSFLILNFASLISKAQTNLVPNPSFEDTVSCPSVFGDFSVSDWNSPTQGSPDYLNTCNIGDANVPNNLLGSQLALSGNAYVGIGVYDTQSIYSYREYIQVQLQQSLTSGQKYWVSFYVSLSDSTDYAIQELGAYFSANQITDNSMDTTLSFIPQVEFNDSIITDKTNWTKVNGFFTANGNENYIIIGNFNRGQTTTVVKVSNYNVNYSYYYIDNICVSTDSSFCANYIYTKVQEEQLKDNFNIHPNPIVDYFHINKAFKEPYDLIIYNALGQNIYEKKNINADSKTIDATPFSKGILLINIKSGNQSINYKLLKQ